MIKDGILSNLSNNLNNILSVTVGGGTDCGCTKHIGGSKGGSEIVIIRNKR
ncbi:MAG: hypothetical protein IJZ79_06660 [Bacilli bacterium]|nr:hypothetical protein [Bacilli bacterium]